MKHHLKVHGELHLDWPLHRVFILAVSLLSLGVNVGALPFVPWSTGVCGFLTSNMIGLILFKLNPMSFSLKDLNLEKEPDLLINMWVFVITLHDHLHFLVGQGNLFICHLDDLISICLLKVITTREITWNRNL